MGVSGSGKSTVGAALADALGLRFVDADSLHPQANVDKMSSGIPLTDEDRWPWLDLVAQVLAGGDVVVACSALRRSYRDRLRVLAPDLRLVYLRAEPGRLADRMESREHFMPATLLPSQVATLEPPGVDERPVVVDASDPVADVVRQALGGL